MEGRAGGSTAREDGTAARPRQAGAQPNFFTINGRSFPATDTIKMKVGETVKIRFIGSNSGFIQPMHIHGGPGQRHDVVWKAREPGTCPKCGMALEPEMPAAEEEKSSELRDFSRRFWGRCRSP